MVENQPKIKVGGDRLHQKLAVEHVLTAELATYEHNSRTHSAEQVRQLAKSIEEFGFTNPVLIDEAGILIAGHGRLEASKLLGLERVPAIRLVGLTDDQKKALRIADNKLALNAGWNDELLKLELGELELAGFDLDLVGFSMDELRELLPYDETESDDSDELPDADTVETRCKRGAVWQLGEHRLMCGDSTSDADVARLIDGDALDVIFTDPPYGMGLDSDYAHMISKLDKIKSAGMRGTAYDKKKVDAFEPRMIELILGLDAKEVFLWGADYYAELLANRNDGSWFMWDKRCDESADKMIGSCFELCWSKRKHKRDIARIKWAGMFGLNTEFDKKRFHPTQKPTSLARWFLDKYSKAGSIVLDLFGGSGSTLIACEQIGRRCLMMELDEVFCDTIIARWEQLTERKAVKL